MALKKTTKIRRERKRTFVYNFLLNTGCSVKECTECDPIVLDFDHRTNKRYLVSAMINGNYSMDTVIKEITKCRVLCSNDHRRYTAQQQDWYKDKK